MQNALVQPASVLTETLKRTLLVSKFPSSAPSMKSLKMAQHRARLPGLDTSDSKPASVRTITYACPLSHTLTPCLLPILKDELEGLLREKDKESPQPNGSNGISRPSSDQSFVHSPDPNTQYVRPAHSFGRQPSVQIDPTVDSYLPDSSQPLSFTPQDATMSPMIAAHISPVTTPPTGFISAMANNSPHHGFEASGEQVFWSNWPQNLPTPQLLQHL